MLKTWTSHILLEKWAKMLKNLLSRANISLEWLCLTLARLNPVKSGAEKRFIAASKAIVEHKDWELRYGDPEIKRFRCISNHEIEFFLTFDRETQKISATLVPAEYKAEIQALLIKIGISALPSWETISIPPLFLPAA